MGAVVTVLRIDREAIFLVLQLGEEFEHALTADAGGIERLYRKGIRARFLRAREGQELAERGLLAGHHDPHRRVASASCDRERSEYHGGEGDPGRFLGPFRETERVAARHVAELV